MLPIGLSISEQRAPTTCMQQSSIFAEPTSINGRISSGTRSSARYIGMGKRRKQLQSFREAQPDTIGSAQRKLQDVARGSEPQQSRQRKRRNVAKPGA